MCFWSKFKLDCSYEIIWDFQFLSYIWPDWIGTGFPPASQDIRSYSETSLELLHLSHSWGFCCSWTSSGGAWFSLSVQAIKQFSDVSDVFWCFWCFRGPYSPTASWDFLQTHQFSALLHSPSSAKCAIRDEHPCSQCSWANPSAPWPDEPLWPGAVCCCPVNSSYPNTWLFTSLGIHEYYSLLIKHQEKHHFTSSCSSWDLRALHSWGVQTCNFRNGPFY